MPRFAILVLPLLLPAATDLWAGAGELDPSFGVGGRLQTAFGGDSSAQAMARQGDGRYVVAGTAEVEEGAGYQLAVIRYLPDGSLDPSFGAGGKVLTPLANAYPRAVFVLDDGRIVVAGSAFFPSEIVAVRYLANGTLDPTFGAGGIARAALASAVAPPVAAVQSGGRVVVASSPFSGSAADDLSVVRFDAGGNLDASFAAGGIATIDFGGLRDFAGAVTIEPDDRIVVGGWSWLDPATVRGGTYVTLARLSAGGTLDPTFATGGRFQHYFASPYGTYESIRGMLRLPDGSVLVAGSSNELDPMVDSQVVRSQAFFLRIDAAGGLDPTFGTGGIARPSPRIVTFALALAPDGKLVTIGAASTAAFTNAFGVARYHPDGSPDLTFGDRGVVGAVLHVPHAVATAGVVEPDGTIAAAGVDSEACEDGDSYGLCYHMGLARFLGAAAPCATDADCEPCESCSAEGACVFGPRTACTGALPRGAKLRIDTPYGRVERHGVRLTWTGSTPLDFDPLAADGLGLCLYLEDQRELRLVAPAGGVCDGHPCWQADAVVGFRYRDRAAAQDGMQKIQLTTSKATIEARGEKVINSMHGLPFPGVIEGNYTSVVAQVHGGGTCFGATFTDLDITFRQVARHTYTWTALRAVGQ